MGNKGILVVVSGFSGAGKGTIMKELMKKDGYALSISATTRKPRPGEEDGKSYFFKTRDEFEEMIQQDDLIEWAEYVGNYYGTPKSYVESQLNEGKNVLLEIEMQGGMIVKKKFPDALLIFITPPSADVLHDRLVGRGTEDIETVNKRLSRACEEASYITSYDYLVINDKLEDAVENLHSIIINEKCKVSNSQDLIQEMKKELKKFEAKNGD
jgi:guanylate kinase